MNENQASLVSIILPTYNGQKYLRQSIRSCLEQSYQNFELVIIDDASVPEVRAIVDSFGDARVRYVRNDKNLGLVMSLNKGFSLAKGKYLTWTSDDNYYASKAIEIMQNALADNAAVSFVYAGYQVIDNDGHPLRRGRVETPEELDQDNYIGGCFLYRREVYETIGDFNAEAFLAEDYEYWLRIRTKFKMKKLDEVLYFYRAHERSLTAVHSEAKVQMQVERIREKFIAPWKRHYFRGKKYFYNGQKRKSWTELWLSVVLNPFYYESWRLIGLLIVSPQIADSIRKLKSR